MGRYVIERLAQTVIMVAILSILFFLLIRFAPAPNPCSFGDQVCVAREHLDEPLSTQYLLWVESYLRGDLGYSRGGQPVATMMVQKLPPTVLLVGVSFLVQQLIALPLGILAAIRQYSFFDLLFSVGAYVGLSFPGFVLGLLGLYVFAVRWRLLPVGHYEDLALPLLWSADWFRALAADPWYVVGDLAWHLILPVFVLIVTGVAIDSRFMRASMLQVIRQDYVRTARAKGLSGMRVLLKHALRNALLPILTNMALYLPSFVGGVIVVEIVFTWGGLGYAFGSALSEGDGTFLQAVLVLSTLTVVLANLLADLSYGWLDPRVRYE